MYAAKKREKMSIVRKNAFGERMAIMISVVCIFSYKSITNLARGVSPSLGGVTREFDFFFCGPIYKKSGCRNPLG